ncbi:hypothetical protein BSLG_002583 [Batrachochytrium salamandrivorans]|nr:hypothetical protein BSLG_002583 [Batrachochytrium salamandrivorans]
MVVLPPVDTSITSPDALDGVKPLLAVVQGYVLFRPWTLLTAGFTESRLGFLIINVPSLLFMGRYFENHWGAREFAKYTLVVTISTYLATTLALYATYIAYMDTKYLFGVQANGLGGLLCGFVVAFKQAVPEHNISLYHIISIRAKHLPSIIFLVHFFLYALGMIHVSFYIEIFGMIASWVYIRYYKVQDGIRGDRSETFSFASFFPDALHPVLKPLSTYTYRFMVKYRLLPPLPAKSIIGDVPPPPPRAPPGSEKADAERRRALALRTLDQRLQDQKSTPETTELLQMESMTPQEKETPILLLPQTEKHESSDKTQSPRTE